MSIHYNQATGVFSLLTAHSLYQMQVDGAGVLLHLYYGQKTGAEMGYLIHYQDRGYSGNPYEQRSNRGYSLDTLPQEYAGNGVGDYRIPAVQVIGLDGSRSVDPRFAAYRIFRGRPSLEELPFAREGEDTETLQLTLQDPVIGLEIQLMYHVFSAQDVIVRSTRIINAGRESLTLLKAASACLDFQNNRFEVLHFHGRHCMERMAQRVSLPAGITSFGSRRGMSSHHSNPFLILTEPGAMENQGMCYGAMLMYSGNHLEEIEVDQTESLRLVTGIHPDGFSWELTPGACFQTPEALLAFSDGGLNGLSHLYHEFLRRQVIPSRWREAPSPVLINSWEAAYFHFNAEKLLRLARSARELGMEMLVLDDGWFGHRSSDRSSLGDWTVNEEKLGCSLGALSDSIHEMGLRFGLWFEPEMISEDSELYQAHPDWVLCDPDRKPMVARDQLVLDLGRPEVVDYLFSAFSSIFSQARIEYIKWDFNRPLANCYSQALSPSRQGETAHRFMLGTYALLRRVRSAWPELLIEGCAGGGGRFDAGMLYYCPQIWCSDDTDAVERLEIQRGTSYGYPACVMGSHVSASPNHQTGRTLPLSTRGIVAQAGALGYELDLELLSREEKEEIKSQIVAYGRHEKLLRQGRMYRLTELEDDLDYTAWMVAASDQSEALVSVVTTHVRANALRPFLRLRGLDPERLYQLEGSDLCLPGAALMAGGYVLPPQQGDYPACQMYFRAV